MFSHFVVYSKEPGGVITSFMHDDDGVPAPNWQKQVVVSERLVTGQNPASAAGVAEAVIAALRGEAR